MVAEPEIRLPGLPDVPDDEESDYADAPAGDTEGTLEPEYVAPPPVDEDVIQFRRSTFLKDLARLDREDPHLRTQLHDYASRKARREGKLEVEQRDAQIAFLSAQLFKQEAAKMPEQQLNAALRNNPQFRQAWDAAQTAKAPDPQTAEHNEWVTAFEDDLDDALADGIPPETVETYRQAMLNGHFDEHDGKKLSRQQSYRLFQKTLAWQKTQVQQPQAVYTPVQRTPPRTNQALATAQPEVSTRGGNGLSTAPMRWSEFNKLPFPEQEQLFPGRGAIEKAVLEGKLVFD